MLHRRRGVQFKAQGWKFVALWEWHRVYVVRVRVWRHAASESMLELNSRNRKKNTFLMLSNKQEDCYDDGA
jgi:hypothetical protein